MDNDNFILVMLYVAKFCISQLCHFSSVFQFLYIPWITVTVIMLHHLEGGAKILKWVLRWSVGWQLVSLGIRLVWWVIM